MERVDFKKELKELFSASAKTATMVDVPKMNFLMFDGQGDPNTVPEFPAGTEALYSVAYHLKFALKKGEAGLDYVVPPLEGLWWADDPQVFQTGDKSAWKWTLMIMQPKEVTKTMVKTAIMEVGKKKELEGLARVRFESFKEGKAAQILHVGPYASEGPSIEKLMDFIKENDKSLSGKHHEIYLGDHRRTAPEKLKTIIRHPIK